MKLNIMQKLLIVVTLPIITLLIFSANFINDKYKILSSNKLELNNLSTMQTTSNLIHELQIERGVSASYLSIESSQYFSSKLTTHKKKTDRAILIYKKSISNLDKAFLSKSSIQYMNDTQTILESLKKTREMVQQKTIKVGKSFHYYTLLNNNLISILNGFRIHTVSYETNTEITALSKVIALQESAGQERALIANLSYSQNLTDENMRQLRNLINSQKEIYKEIIFLLKNTDLDQSLQKIHKEYRNNFFYKIKSEILNNELKKDILNHIYKVIGYGGMIHDLTKYDKSNNERFYKEFLLKKVTFDKIIKQYLQYTLKGSQEYKIAKLLQASFDTASKDKSFKIDPMGILQLYKTLQNAKLSIESKKWFKVSTQRINDIHSLEDSLIDSISKSLNEDIETTNNALFWQILITLATIVLLLIGTFYITNRIKYAITQLENGLDDFFKFLNFESEKVKDIQTQSDDEISDMAQKINKNRVLIEEKLAEDQDFINEITQIVMLMKDGDFSERPYFEPHNPNLKELKSVFDELIELISSKIKEQTDSLERLNSSLEDRVHHQTLELENQITDITKARDEAIQAEIAKDEFLANMSHEIRTPLNAILGFVTILKKRISEDKSLNYLNIIDTSGQSLLTIINDILDFSKIQSGKFTISPYPINPVQEFSDAMLLFASKAYEKHLVYAVYIDPNLPQSINIDAVRVKQILSNILSNAIKFTPEDGSIKVSVTMKDSELLISVQDSGIGISTENQAKVFNAFEQADGSTTRKYGGTGLGLSISSKLASLMDGKLTLVSEVGSGSIFTLKMPVEILNELPLALIERDKISSYTFGILSSCEGCVSQVKLIKKYLSDFGATDIVEFSEFRKDGYDILFFVPDDEYNEEVVSFKKASIAMLRSSSIKLANLTHLQPLYAPFTPKAITQAINDSNIKDLTLVTKKEPEITDDEPQYSGLILVAEDNKTNQMLISLILDDYGIEHVIANNGLEAVDMFLEGKFDMVLMDENMPELNGIGAMQRIKEYESKKALITTPIIALTASVLETDKEMFIKAGMDGFVGKPINVKELEKELNKYLKRL